MTPSKEDYIKAVFEAGAVDEFTSNKTLTQALNISGASVTEMNNRLSAEGFIEYVPYRGVRLTQAGLDLAHQLIRKHRIWEVFLVDVLGFSWDEVHEEADKLEHASSDEVADRLFVFLGEPEHDPHGALIPNRDGRLPERQLAPLTDLEIGDCFYTREFNDQSEVLQYTRHKDIHLNSCYTVYNKEPFDEAIIIQDSQGKERYITQSMARHIYVEITEKTSQG